MTEKPTATDVHREGAAFLVQVPPDSVLVSLGSKVFVVSPLAPVQEVTPEGVKVVYPLQGGVVDLEEGNKILPL